MAAARLRLHWRGGGSRIAGPIRFPCQQATSACAMSAGKAKCTAKGGADADYQEKEDAAPRGSLRPTSSRKCGSRSAHAIRLDGEDRRIDGGVQQMKRPGAVPYRCVTHHTSCAQTNSRSCASRRRG